MLGEQKSTLHDLLFATRLSLALDPDCWLSSHDHGIVAFDLFGHAYNSGRRVCQSSASLSTRYTLSHFSHMSAYAGGSNEHPSHTAATQAGQGSVPGSQPTDSEPPSYWSSLPYQGPPLAHHPVLTEGNLSHCSSLSGWSGGNPRATNFSPPSAWPGRQPVNHLRVRILCRFFSGDCRRLRR